ncbi:flagellar biosynthetic protein FliR [Azomonas macrocytogenes]|uniref:Flagellar biosynthetic protein FliR n=1 Tax=Azomonas macrocytogenes TaxID=69962 RepID=A0A839SWR4_AZOMA|nr:flagellar biosynthetic protein FliR [Azomonas macrocytogenes]MBB3101827.1 flagellar biosynthetic protein FliR [Azomonas macrocytogenes]
MFELSDTQIGGWVGQFMLPLFRVAALLMSMPVIGTQVVPVRIRLYLSLAITLVLVPALPAMPQVDALSLQTLVLIAQEVLIGVMLGFALQLFFQLFVLAGQLLATQMGLGFASMMDPVNGVSVPVLGQFFNVLVVLLFLTMNGHLVVLDTLAESFTSLPVGEALSSEHYWAVATRLGWVLGAGLLLVLPAITALLVINLAFGLMTRAAPQLNIFSIGLPLTLVLGMVIVWVGLADIFAQYQVFVTDALQWLRELIRAP